MNCLVYSLGLAESGKSLHFTISRFPHQTESGFVKMSLHKGEIWEDYFYIGVTQNIVSEEFGK